MKNLLNKIKNEIEEREKFHENLLLKQKPLITVIDENTGKQIIENNTDYYITKGRKLEDNIIIEIIQKYTPEDCDDISDGYHTFKELYDYRMIYNATLFNLMAAIDGNPYNIHKSKKHDDGQPCFNGDMFIVQATLTTGQISNHYNLKYWDLFNIPQKEKADKWDNHTPQQAFERLKKFCQNKIYPLQYK